MGDRMARLPQLTRSRAAAALGVSLGVGVGGGVLGSVVLAQFLALPEGAELPTLEDAAPPPATGASGEGQVASADDPADDPEASRPVGGDKKSFTDIIVRRNIFDAAATFAAAEQTAATQDCKESKVTLLATVVAEVPDYSSALISSGSKSSRALGYKVGDQVGGEGRILSIDQKKVCLDGGGCLCMGSDVKRSSVAVGGEESGGVTKLSDTQFVVDRDFVEKQLGNVETLATQIRAVPKTENGEVVGFRLSSVRKGSTFDKLGIKNGDVVHSVNGKGLTSADGALGAYQSLSGESNFTFEITRRNQKMTLAYEVR